MAILIEEEKSSVNWVGVIAGVIVAALVLSGGYYIFFKDPGVIDKIIPPRTLQNVSGLSSSNIDPNEVINLPIFKLLQDYSTQLPLPPVGNRSNPFSPL